MYTEEGGEGNWKNKFLPKLEFQSYRFYTNIHYKCFVATYGVGLINY